MAARFDVAARLAEGSPTVDDIQTYVTACHVRGYQHPDLTLHGAQVREHYGTEDGLDLAALDADCAALRVAAEAVGEAIGLAQSQGAALAAAWTGPGADSAADFVRRHCDSALRLADAVRAAAESCAALRDELWRIVDRKVEATQAVGDRTQARRPAWLAAARAVTGGDAQAGEVVDTEVKPFVDNDIRGTWVADMLAAAGAAGGAYRAALDGLGIRAGIRFEVPGEFGPHYLPPARTAAPPPAVAPAAASMPAAPPPVREWPAGPSEVLAPPAAGVPMSPPNALAPLASAAPTPGADALPGLGAQAMPDLSGAAAAPARLADALRGLLGAPTDPLSRPVAEPLSDSGADDLPDPPDADASKDAEAEDTDAAKDAAAEDANDAETAEEAPEAEPAREPEPAAARPPEQTPAPASVPAPPPPAAATPCEIAADELPQAGQ